MYSTRMPRISFTIVTVNYNSGAKFAETARSVINQSANYEYIIIDGGSNDISLSCAENLLQLYPEKVRLISERDGGVYDAMNKAIRLSQGRYIYFIGSGDKLRDEVLMRVEQQLPQDDNTLVYGDVIWGTALYDGKFDHRKIRRKNLSHQAAFYGRNLFMRLGVYELKYVKWADWAFNLKVFNDKESETRYIPLTVADYEGGGFSEQGPDAVFLSDHKHLLVGESDKGYVVTRLLAQGSRLVIRTVRLLVRLMPGN